MVVCVQKSAQEVKLNWYSGYSFLTVSWIAEAGYMYKRLLLHLSDIFCNRNHFFSNKFKTITLKKVSSDPLEPIVYLLPAVKEQSNNINNNNKRKRKKKV